VASVTTPALSVLAEDAVPARPLSITMGLGARAGPGRSARREADGTWWRAEQGAGGPVALEVRPSGERLILRVHGDPSTPAPEVDAALRSARAWAGLDDELSGFADLVSGHPVLRRLMTRLGPPVLGVLPRASEAFGIALLHQRVQGAEAARSHAQLLRLLGTPVLPGLLAYPARQVMHAVPAHALRPCGISQVATRAFHLFAADEPAAQRFAVAKDWERLDVLIRRIPGCGVWTSAETRLVLGDADAVSYGDFHTATTVGWAIGERSETDEAMAELLAPFAPHRGRVVRLIERGVHEGLVPVKPRRAPRAALSVHRHG